MRLQHGITIEQKILIRVKAVQRQAERFVLGNYVDVPENRLSDQIWNIFQVISFTEHRPAVHDQVILYKIHHHLINIPLPETLLKELTNPSR